MKKINIDKTPDGICFRPMLFSTPMVHSLLNRTKTQTRRLVQRNVQLGNYDKALEKSILKVGDIIWVRETFSYGDIENGEYTGYKYKANDRNYNVLWKPSLFMPKKACRIWLKITNIRVERLQDISEEDAINEGIYGINIRENENEPYIPHFKDYSIKFPSKKMTQNILPISPIESYKSLWEEINGIGSWNENPFVWIYEFEIIDERPINFL